MASSKLLTDILWDGTQEFAHFDPDGNLTGLQYVSDHTSVIESNKRAQNEGNKGYGETREWQHIASIPVAVLMDYCNKHGVPMDYALGGPGQMEVINKIINDFDYRYLRTDV